MPGGEPAHSSIVAVTGAAGFVGRRVCAELIGRGAIVRAIVRGNEAPAGTERIVIRDLDDTPALSRALEGTDAVIHLAARVHVMRDTAIDPLSEFRQVNVEGTRTLLDTAIRAGVRRFVYVSSVKAVGEFTITPWTAATPPAPLDPYGMSKLEAERLVRDAQRVGHIRSVVVRFPLVYGPGVKGNMLRLFRLVSRGMWIPVSTRENARSVLFVGNAAHALMALATDDRTTETAGAVFFARDAENVSSERLVRGIAQALGVRAHVLRVPSALLATAGKIGDGIRRIVPFPLTSAALQRISSSLVVDASPLWAAVGAPPFTIEQGLAATAEWYKRGDGEHA